MGFIKIRRHARAISIIDMPRLAFLPEQQQQQKMEERNEVSISASVSEVAVSCFKSLISRHVTEIYFKNQI